MDDKIVRGLRSKAQIYDDACPPTLFMLVGLPASGKSTYSKELAEEHNATIFSSDSLREELFNDINEQSRNAELFTELHKRIKDCLKSGKSAIYDACNHHKRKGFLQELNNIECFKVAVVMATPYEECLRRSVKRDRHVPEYVIKRMYKSFEMPGGYEHWDSVWVRYSENSYNSFGKPENWIDSVMDFNQDNPHHTHTLGEHCLSASKWIEEHFDGEDTHHLSELKYAAMLHDAGKVFTKSFVDSKGNPSETAHFYQHYAVGAYDSLFYEFEADHLYVAQLIQWHMQMYFNKEQKTIDKYRKMWGEELYRDLCILHEADLAAH